jgi:hypothetical protein
MILASSNLGEEVAVLADRSERAERSARNRQRHVRRHLRAGFWRRQRPDQLEPQMTAQDLLRRFSLALAVWREARGESLLGKLLVAQTIEKSNCSAGDFIGFGSSASGRAQPPRDCEGSPAPQRADHG